MSGGRGFAEWWRRLPWWKWAAVGAVAVVVVIMGAMSDQPADQDATTPAARTAAPAAPSRADVRAMTRTLRAFFAAYNRGEYAKAIGYVSRAVTERCGGPTEHAHRYARHRRIARTTYRLRRVQEAWVDDGIPTLDITFTERNERTGRRVKGGPAGQGFVREGGSWVLVDDWPVAMCADD